MSTDSPQRPLPGIPISASRRANKISRKASRKRHRLPVLQTVLVADHAFDPVAGVPTTRGDCPVSKPCVHVRCRWHLFREDAEHRAGRPGLSSVPRDAQGRTLSQPGMSGTERSGTTLRPSWLTHKGLEVEREVRVWIHTDEDGLHVYESTKGALGYWLARLHPGEPIHVIDDDSASPFYKQPIAHATLTQDRELKLDRYPGRMFVILRRVRGVASCALDLIDQHGKLTNTQAGDANGRHRTLAARDLKRALEKAKAVAREMGMTEADLLRGLRELGAG